MGVVEILLAPANIVVDVRRASTQSIVVCLQDKGLAQNVLLARQVSIVQIAETKVGVFLKLDCVIRVLGVPRVSIEVGAQMALLELANTVQPANTRVLSDQKPVHLVPRHQTVQQDNIAVDVDKAQECLTRVHVIIVTATHTVPVGPWTAAHNVQHVTVPSIL